MRRATVGGLCGLVVVASVLAVAVAAQPNSNHMGARPDPAMFKPPVEVWANRTWTEAAADQAVSSFISGPRAAGKVTHQLSSRSVLDRATGDVFFLRYSASPTREYVFIASPSGKVISTASISPAIPLSCAPEILLTSPLIVHCTYGKGYVYAIARGAVKWKRAILSDSSDRVYAHMPDGNMVSLLVIPSTAPSGLARVEEYTIRTNDGTVVSALQKPITVVPTNAGGGLVATPVPQAAWILASNAWAQRPQCYEIAKLDNALHVVWKQRFSGNCGGSDIPPPSATPSRVYVVFSGDSSERLLFLDLRTGHTVWSTTIVTGVQYGYIYPPIVGAGAHCLYLAGFGDGSFVGEEPGPSAKVYAYLASISQRTGAIAWKARMLTEIQQNGGSQWELYSPTEATCAGGSVEVFDPESVGSRLASYPLAVIIRAWLPNAP